MNLHMLPLLCCLLLSPPIDGRVYLKETFSTVEPEHLGVFKHSRRTKEYSEFEGIYTEDTFKYYRMTRKSAPFANLNKTLIFQYEFQYPRRHEGKLHKWKKRGTFPGDEDRHLLTLRLFPNDTYAVNLDMETIAGGRLVDDFTEFPPEFIYNASVAKPNDWDDKEFYEDPSDRKPIYWEDEKIPDPDFDPHLTQGLDSEPWDIPTVANPHRIYEWQPRRLRNPRYMGPWLGQPMENPNFSTSLHDLGVIGGVAFDIWQVR
ncbi:unnamed protein product [Dibothriocephalus latus]|uniref:Uncharacterized protein n=1 Tax=Dibothriocephalus latus TaxID=60516 RepID=A0A3P7LHE3_DIBLA|nr:unnamed protein product [Dibothriocephalus latus]